MHINRKEFDERCKEIAEDISNQRTSSPAWFWIGLGAVTGLLLSCVRFSRNVTRPIMAGYHKTGEKDGESNSFGRRKNY